MRSLTFLAIVAYFNCVMQKNYANHLSSDEMTLDHSGASIYMSDDSSASSSWPVLGSAAGGGAGAKAGQTACVSIPRNFSLCHGIDYDKMRLPNLLEHETLDEAVQQSMPWVSLLRLNCHTDVKLFLCSLFAPVCLERAIYPCRSLCETVKAGCEKRMQAYGFPWPDMLNCAKFPVMNDMCIQPRENYQVNQSCSSCDQVDTFENILDHFCRSDYVFKVKVHALGQNVLQVKRGKAFKVKSPQNLQNFPLNGLKLKLTDGGENETPCPCNVLSQDRSLEKRYLVMANRTSGGDYVLNLVLPWKKEKMQFKRAKRMFHKLDCKTLGTRIRERARRERTKMLTTQAAAAAAASSSLRQTRRPPNHQNSISTSPAPNRRRNNGGGGQKNRQKTAAVAQLTAKNGLRASGQHRQRKIDEEKSIPQHNRRNHHHQNGRKNRKNSASKNGRQTNGSLENAFL